MTGSRWRLAAYLLVVAMGAIGLWRVEQTATAVADEAQTRADEQCVTGWAVREDIRDAIERGAEAHAAAIQDAIAAVTADPARAEPFLSVYREQLPAHMAAARGEIPDPECDLDAARRELGG